VNDTIGTKFVALAQKRMNHAIKSIRQIGKLDNRGHEYSRDDVETMFSALANEVQAMRERLLTGAQGEPDFRLGPHGCGDGEGAP
jgi:hypothetical protein